MSNSILDRPAGASESAPRCVLVAGASGGIGAAFCTQITQSFPTARIIRMARDPAALEPLTTASVDVRLDIAEEQQIRDAVALIPETPPIDWIFVATGWLHDEEHTPVPQRSGLDDPDSKRFS